MKKLLILLVICSFIISVQAQKSVTKNDVPPKVMKKALQIRPQVNNERLPIKWQKDGVHYKVLIPGIRGEKFPQVTCIDSAGNFIYMEDFIEPENLPLKARDYLLGKDPNTIISEAYKVQDSSYKITFRAVVISKPKFDKDGNLISGTPAKLNEIKK